MFRFLRAPFVFHSPGNNMYLFLLGSPSSSPVSVQKNMGGSGEGHHHLHQLPRRGWDACRCTAAVIGLRVTLTARRIRCFHMNNSPNFISPCPPPPLAPTVSLTGGEPGSLVWPSWGLWEDRSSIFHVRNRQGLIPTIFVAAIFLSNTVCLFLSPCAFWKEGSLAGKNGEARWFFQPLQIHPTLFGGPLAPISAALGCQ